MQYILYNPVVLYTHAILNAAYTMLKTTGVVHGYGRFLGPAGVILVVWDMMPQLVRCGPVYTALHRNVPDGHVLLYTRK